MPRLPIALLFLLAPLIALADDPEGRSIPYQKLYAPLAAVRQADPQGVVTSSLQAESAQADQPLPADLKIELRNGASHQPIPVDPDGRFTLPMRSDLPPGAALWINQPKTTVKIVENFTMRKPTAPHLSYGQLMESLPVMERIQNQHADIAGLLSSAPTGVELAYDPGATQSVTVGTGAKAKTWNTDDRGHVEVPFDPSLPASTPVVLSALPIALRPYAN